MAFRLKVPFYLIQGIIQGRAGLFQLFNSSGLGCEGEGVTHFGANQLLESDEREPAFGIDSLLQVRGVFR